MNKASANTTQNILSKEIGSPIGGTQSGAYSRVGGSMGQSKLVSPLGGQSISGPQGYSLRGTIESLEGKIADIVSEISYHR